MDIGALRSLVLDKAAGAFGVPAVVTPTGASPIAATGIWMPPISEDMPVGRDFQRREPRRVIQFRVAEAGALPRGTTIAAAEHGGVLRLWKVDGVELQTAEQIRVIVVPA